MGSPLSPVIANIYMEHLEETTLRTAPLQPTLWLEYVDDAFVIWPHGHKELQHFHEHINQQYPNIQFTMEEEKDGKQVFLDVQVPRSTNLPKTDSHWYIDTSPFTLTITREQPPEYWDVCVTGYSRSAAAHLGSLSRNVSRKSFKLMATQKTWWEGHSHLNPLHPPYLSPDRIQRRHSALLTFMDWEKTWKGVHFTWCTCSLQTDKDTQADTNETQNTYARWEKERSCVWSPMKGMQEDLCWRNEQNAEDLENTNKQWRRATPRMELPYMLTRPSMRLIGMEQKWKR